MPATPSTTPHERNILSAVEQFYGEAAVALVRIGYTVDAAIDHVTGQCDVTICTHPTHSQER